MSVNRIVGLLAYAIFGAAALLTPLAAQPGLTARQVRMNGQLLRIEGNQPNALSIGRSSVDARRLELDGCTRLLDVSTCPAGYVVATGLIEGRQDSARHCIWVADCSDPSAPRVMTELDSVDARIRRAGGFSSAALAVSDDTFSVVALSADRRTLWVTEWGARSTPWTLVHEFDQPCHEKRHLVSGSESVTIGMQYEWTGLGVGLRGLAARTAAGWEYTAIPSASSARNWIQVRSPLTCDGELLILSSFAGAAALVDAEDRVVGRYGLLGRPDGGETRIEVRGLTCGQSYQLRARNGATSPWFRPYLRAGNPRSRGTLGCEPLHCAPPSFFAGSSVASVETRITRVTGGTPLPVEVAIAVAYAPADAPAPMDRGVLRPHLVRLADTGFSTDELATVFASFVPVPESADPASTVWIQVCVRSGVDVARSDVIGCRLEDATSHRSPSGAAAAASREAMSRRWDEAGSEARLRQWTRWAASLRD